MNGFVKSPVNSLQLNETITESLTVQPYSYYLDLFKELNMERKQKAQEIEGKRVQRQQEIKNIQIGRLITLKLKGKHHPEKKTT